MRDEKWTDGRTMRRLKNFEVDRYVVWMKRRRRRRCVAVMLHMKIISRFSRPLTRTSFLFLKTYSFYCLLVACSFTSSNIQFMLEWPSNVYIHRYICYDILCIVLYFLLCCTSVAFFLLLLPFSISKVLPKTQIHLQPVSTPLFLFLLHSLSISTYRKD